MNRLFDHPRLLGLVCAAVAVGLGIDYLLVAGAPHQYPVVNVAAFVIGLAVWLVAPFAAARWHGGAVLVLAATLLVATLVSAEVNGASRWVSAGPLSLQPSLIVLPAIIVLYARKTDLIGTIGIVAAAVALAAQPDRAMAGVLAAGTGAIVTSRPGWLNALAFGAAVTSFGAAMLQPDVVPPAPFVENVLHTAFDVHMLMGFAVVIGCGALLTPTLSALRDRSSDPVPLAFGASWAAVIAASTLGNYPTPLIGYGGSAVLGYLLSAALLPPPRHRAPQVNAS